MKKIFFIFLFFLTSKLYSQNIISSHELNTMFVGKTVLQKNDKFSKAIPTRILYWHLAYTFNLETRKILVNEKAISIGRGIGGGVMPIAVISNAFLPILGIDDKVEVFSINHQFLLNYYQTNNLVFRGGYQGLYFDVSDYDFVDNYNNGFFLGGKVNVGGNSFVCLDINTQRFRIKDYINFSNIPQTHYLYGVTIHAQKYFGKY